MGLNRILLVEDDRTTNFITRMTFESAGYKGDIKECLNAKEALAVIKEAHQGKEACPQLILLDINMPGMNGWEFYEAYQKLSPEKDCGSDIVMLTTSLNPADQQRSKEIGCSGYITKPITKEDVQSLMTKIGKKP